MPEEPTTPDLVALGLQAYEALSCGDFDAVMSLFAADAVYDGSDAGIGIFEGAEPIRGFIEDWFRSWEEYRYEAEEILDLGHGLVVFVLRESGRLIGSNGRVEQRAAHVTTWADGLIERVTAFSDVDEARNAAEQLAEQRRYAVSANLDLARSIYADWERGDVLSRADWADPDIEFTVVDGPEPGNWNGLAAMADAFRAFLGAWKDYRYRAEGYRTLDDERVLALTRLEGRGKTTDMDIRELQGSVKRLVVYWHRDRALADLGLEG